MADIVGSREKDQATLMKGFKTVIKAVNDKFQDKIISPLTITLGDEFQGVIIDLPWALEIIINIEEEIIHSRSLFKMRYVLFKGEIETSINKTIAYEMLGDGLTKARQLLENSKSTNDRFYIDVKNTAQSNALLDAFRVFQGIVDDWQIEKNWKIFSTFIELKDYKLVAESLDKDRSLMWRREKTGKIKEYLSIKSVINYIGKQ